MILTVMSSPSRATVHSAIPGVSQFVFIQRPRRLSGLRFAAAGLSRSGCRWLFCVKFMYVKVILRRGVILAQEIVRAVAVVFESMKLGQHEQPFHDHCLE